MPSKRGASAQRFQPFRDFVGPGRRRTDHPIVVATIVLCLGLITVISIAQMVTMIWVGNQVKVAIDGEKRRDGETKSMRETIIKAAEAEANILRRVCLNVAKSERDQQECLALVPHVSPQRGAN